MKPSAPYATDPARGWMPPGLLAPLLCIALVAVPDASVSLLLKPFHLGDAQGNPNSVLAWCVFLLGTFGLMGLVFLTWVGRVERRPLATLGLGGTHRARQFAGGYAIGLVAIGLTVAAIALAGGFRAGALAPAFASPAGLLGIALLAPGFALQSSVEEMIFRGWLLSGVARKLNLPLGVALSSATFTLLHYEKGQQWATTLAIVLFSLFACALSLRARSIWPAMGWHAAWNWLCAVGFDLPVTAMPSHVPALLVKLSPVGSVVLTGGAQGPEGSIWCSVVLVAATALVLRLVRPPAPAPGLPAAVEVNFL